MIDVQVRTGLLAVCYAVFIGVCAGAPSASELAEPPSEHHALWEVKGPHNTVFLIGSIHALKAEDSALPAAMLKAYERSEQLVLEIDPTDAANAALKDSALRLEMLPAGQSLASTLGPDLYHEFRHRAGLLGFDTDLMSHFQPWYAATMMESLLITREGWDPANGVDMQLARRAKVDHKPLLTLETVNEQLGFLANLPLPQQREYLRATLEGLDVAGEESRMTIAAWRHGDISALDGVLRSDFREAPELMAILTSERNRRWLPHIVELLGKEQNALVAVGVLHMVGRDGLVDLLRARGFSVVQH